MTPSEETILKPIWRGFYLAELAAREAMAAVSITDRRTYAELDEAREYLKHKSRDYSPDGMYNALVTNKIGVTKVLIWPWNSQDDSARARVIDNLLQRNPKVRARAEKVGMIVNIDLDIGEQPPILITGGTT